MIFRRVNDEYVGKETDKEGQITASSLTNLTK